MIVTAYGRIGFWIQLDEESAEYVGVENSGIFVFTAGPPAVSVGDRIHITHAQVQSYFDQIQLSDADFTIVGSAPLVTPTYVPLEDLPEILAQGADTTLEGILLEFENLEVTDPMPPAGDGDLENPVEFEVENGLRVDDLMYEIFPQPLEGEVFTSIRGILSYRNSLLKLLPRSGDDVRF